MNLSRIRNVVVHNKENFMKIRLLKPYLMSAKGDVINPAEAIANSLIGRKIAEAVIERQTPQIFAGNPKLKKGVNNGSVKN